ncbi:MAG: LCP family protein [Actinomycetota bacterium]|nr:LCP family protein [Actinomycetota bacterium]
MKSVLASLFVPGFSSRRRRTALSIALIVTGFVAPIVVPLILLVSSGGFGELVLDTSSLAVIRVVLVVVVLTRVVAFAEILVSRPNEAKKPATVLAALVGAAVVAVPSVWAYGSIGQVTDAVDEIFLSSGSDEPLATVGPDDADFTTVLLVAGDDGDDRWNVSTDSIVLITTHDPSGRMAMISIDGDVRGLDWSNDSPAGASSIGGANTTISRIFPSVNDDPDLSESYGRGSLAPGAVALADGLSSSLGIGIDDYLYVNLNGVRDVVDVVGTVRVTAAGELEIPALDGSPSELVGPGRIELSGDQAYRLVSTRTDVSDFDVMVRQRIIISSIGKAISGTALLSDLGRLLDVVKNSMRSSLSTSDFLDFLDGLSDRDPTRIDLSLVPDHLDPRAPDWSTAADFVADVRSALTDGSEFSD